MVVFGCGYLGRRLVREALQCGMEVSALTRNPEDAAQVEEIGVGKTVVADLHGRDWHREIEPGPDVAVIAASSGGRGLEGCRESWVEGVRSVLEWAGARGKIGTLIFTSSTSVYAQNAEQWVTESDPAIGSSEASRVLLEAEELLERESADVGRSFVLRLGGIYGPGRHHLLDRARMGDNTTEVGDAVFLNSIHVEDAASAIMAAAAADAKTVAGGIFNIVDDHPTRKSEIFRYLREAVKEERSAVPMISLKPPRRRQAVPRPSRRIANQKAKELLGWQPRFPDFRSGYVELIQPRK